jgi:bifunctional DNA-binding transcriptional regulator/antitoxin component of YhaV-PrlF toxin-antitoxin module
MPQITKGGKWVFGWVVVGQNRQIVIPPEAYAEYGFRPGEAVILLRGSRRSGGFSVCRRAKLETSQTHLLQRAFGQGEIGEGGRIEAPLESGVRPGDRLLAVRGSGFAVIFISRGPIIQRALTYDEIKTYG